jgi:hypothetical protein
MTPVLEQIIRADFEKSGIHEDDYDYYKDCYRICFNRDTSFRIIKIPSEIQESARLACMNRFGDNYISTIKKKIKGKAAQFKNDAKYEEDTE